MEMDSSEFYQDVSGSGGVQYDGNQKNGRHGSPIIKSVGNQGYNTPDFGGINFNNAQIKLAPGNTSEDDDMEWEKAQKVLINPTGKFTDINDKMFYEVDLSKRVDVVGMPDESITGNSSDCGYGA